MRSAMAHISSTASNVAAVGLISTVSQSLRPPPWAWITISAGPAFSTGALPVEIPAVVSNDPDLQRVVEWHGIPYHHLPVTKETKAQQEGKIF